MIRFRCYCVFEMQQPLTERELRSVGDEVAIEGGYYHTEHAFYEKAYAIMADYLLKTIGLKLHTIRRDKEGHIDALVQPSSDPFIIQITRNVAQHYDSNSSPNALAWGLITAIQGISKRSEPRFDDPTVLVGKEKKQKNEILTFAIKKSEELPDVIFACELDIVHLQKTLARYSEMLEVYLEEKKGREGFVWKIEQTELFLKNLMEAGIQIVAKPVNMKQQKVGRSINITYMVTCGNPVLARLWKHFGFEYVLIDGEGMFQEKTQQGNFKFSPSATVPIDKDSILCLLEPEVRPEGLKIATGEDIISECSTIYDGNDDNTVEQYQYLMYFTRMCYVVLSEVNRRWMKGGKLGSKWTEKDMFEPED